MACKKASPLTPEAQARKVRLQRAREWGEGFALAGERMQSRWHPKLQVDLDQDGIPLLRQKGPEITFCVLFQDRRPFCTRYAGEGTEHPGTGPCRFHGGNRYKERVGGAFMTSHAIAAILDVDPWEAVEVALRRAYAWSAWYNAKLAMVRDDEDLRKGGAAWEWVQGAERTTEYVVRYAKIAHDMGLAERRMRAIELEGQMIAQLLATTLHELGLDAATEDRARGIMDVQLRRLADQGQAVIKGELAS